MLFLKIRGILFFLNYSFSIYTVTSLDKTRRIIRMYMKIMILDYLLNPLKISHLERYPKLSVGERLEKEIDVRDKRSELVGICLSRVNALFLNFPIKVIKGHFSRSITLNL